MSSALADPGRSNDEQLEWERRFGRYAAGAALVAALTFLLGRVYLGFALEQRPDATDGVLRAVDRESADFVISGVILAIGLLALGAVLVYLYRATRHRRSQLLIAAFALAIAGAILGAVVAVGQQFALVGAARDFVAAGGGSEEQAKDFLRDRSSLQVMSALGFAANIALGFATIVICLNAMRAGLFSRFMGILGIIIGALLPFAGALPVLHFFWLLALAALFLDRWPGGRGPAWETGEAIPWPRPEQRRRDAPRPDDEQGGDPPPPPADQSRA